MDISGLIFLGLIPILILAFLNFDRLIKIQYEKYREQWTLDGKPRRFFAASSEGPWIRGWIATYRLSFSWLFKMPEWVRNDHEARKSLKKLRLLVLIWNIVIIVWFVISMTKSRINI